MNTILSIPLLLLAGCSKPVADDTFDYRHDWEKYTPIMTKGSPVSSLDGSSTTWYAEGGASRLVPLIEAGAMDWDNHLSCGLSPSETEKKDSAAIIWRCVDEHVSRHATCGIDNVTSGGVTIVLIDQELCDSPSLGLIRHAWGHALGLEEDYRYYMTVMDGHQAHFPRSPSFSPMETDGLRIWALAQGAPGCGDKELSWSWKTHPDMYRSHPDESTFQSLKTGD